MSANIYFKKNQKQDQLLQMQTQGRHLLGLVAQAVMLWASPSAYVENIPEN